MKDIILALFTGVLVTFFFDFFIFLGVFLHYIQHYEIELYYNILFADNQNFFIFFAFTLFFGFLVVYIKSVQFKLSVLSAFFLLSLVPLMPTFGQQLGEFLFLEKEILLQDRRHSYYGDIYYNGREEITFFDYELQRFIKLKKKELLP